MLRRELLSSAVALGLFACARGRRRPDAPVGPSPYAALEGRGQLGVAIYDLADGAVIGHRLDQRFAMCSTFKLVLAAMVLERAAAGALSLAQPLRYSAEDLVFHAPVTGEAWKTASAAGATAAEISIGDAARAAQLTSDNVAANLLIRALGGPAAVTAYCRARGDQVTRLDRLEPEMNAVPPGDERDTTSPRAMATLVAGLLGPDGLPAPERATLRGWMLETQTGLARLRAGLPSGWVAGDKTGTFLADHLTARVNDVAWIERPGAAPLVVAAYYDTGEIVDEVRDRDQAVLAAVGRQVAADFPAR